MFRVLIIFVSCIPKPNSHFRSRFTLLKKQGKKITELNKKTKIYVKILLLINIIKIIIIKIHAIVLQTRL